MIITARHRRRSRLWLSILTAAVLVGSANVLAAPAPSASAADSDSFVFGAIGGDFTALDQAAGKRVARHVYGQFQGRVPTGEMITVNAQNLPWRQVADASAGDALYNDMVRWADTIKSRGGSIQLAFGHEPELASKSSRGGAEEFKRAFRKVVDVFRSRDVTNVKWVLQLTDWSFRTATTSRDYAAKWYPGDNYVDIIGADAYNWYTCGEGQGRDLPLSTVAGGLLPFAKAHGKLASLPEFGANVTVERGKWLRDAHAWLKSESESFASAFYFNHRPTNPDNSDCVWPLTGAAELKAFGELARDTWSVSASGPAVEQPTPSTPAPDRPGVEQPMPDKTVPGKTVPEKTVTEKPTPSEPAHEQTVSGSANSETDAGQQQAEGDGDATDLHKVIPNRMARHLCGHSRTAVRARAAQILAAADDASGFAAKTFSCAAADHKRSHRKAADNTGTHSTAESWRTVSTTRWSPRSWSPIDRIVASAFYMHQARAYNRNNLHNWVLHTSAQKLGFAMAQLR